jgi:hypothetical protein
MKMAHRPSSAELLSLERQHLSRAELDIAQGWTRLHHQQDLLSWLHATGRDTREAERLLLLMQRILVQWERHHALIEQRLAYLQKKTSGT